MTLPRTVAVPGMIDELTAFAELVQGLSDEEWHRPTRCAGWTVADVAGHVIGQFTDVVNFRLDGLGTPEVTQRQVEERRGRSQSELVEELAQSGKLGADIANAFDDAAWEGPAPGATPGTLGFGIEALWYDAYLHADDIRAAVGQSSPRGAGLDASVSHVAQSLTDSNYEPLTLRLDGVDEFTVSGGGRVITGDAFDFVLAATGRGDLAPFGLDEAANIYRG
jgi:uncharacterized protein (TIGR03083 family)